MGGLGGALAGTAVALASAGPAGAKGPQSVTITPPGGDPVEVSMTEQPDGSFGGTEIVDLSEDLGIWETTGDGQALMAEAPTANLGAELIVEWTMYNPVPDDPDAAPSVVQTLYPLAAGGPLVHTAGGQRFFQMQETRSGWFRAPDDLLVTLESLGLEVEFRTSALPAASASPPEGGRRWELPAIAGTAVVLAAVAWLGARRLVRRRVRRGAPVAAG